MTLPRDEQGRQDSRAERDRAKAFRFGMDAYRRQVAPRVKRRAAAVGFALGAGAAELARYVLGLGL